MPRRRAQRLSAEEDEVGGAGVPDAAEDRLRRDEERGDARAGRDRPRRLTGRHADAGEDAAASPAEEGVANRQRRVRARRDDDDHRNDEEGGEARHQPPASRRARSALSASPARSGRQSGEIRAAQRSRRRSSASPNACGRSLSTSIRPTGAPAEKTGTTISERVVVCVVRYRGSAATSPTTTLRRAMTAAPHSPSPRGKRGYAGGPGPSQPTIEISSAPTSYTPTQR